MTARRALALAVLSTALGATVSGCALQPLYAGGSRSAVATTLAGVSVSQIEGEAGWLVRNALRDRLRTAGTPETPSRYRIDIRLDDRIAGFAVRRDDSVTRERRTLRARWQLVDTVAGTTLVDATVASDSGIDVVGSEFATIAAERTALERLAEDIADQIIAQVAQYAQSRDREAGR
jgi:LPS-assembly lipoprotein